MKPIVIYIPYNSISEYCDFNYTNEAHYEKLSQYCFDYEKNNLQVNYNHTDKIITGDIGSIIEDNHGIIFLFYPKDESIIKEIRDGNMGVSFDFIPEKYSIEETGAGKIAVIEKAKLIAISLCVDNLAYKNAFSKVIF